VDELHEHHLVLANLSKLVLCQCFISSTIYLANLRCKCIEHFLLLWHSDFGLLSLGILLRLCLSSTLLFAGEVFKELWYLLLNYILEVNHLLRAWLVVFVVYHGG
jgi:hypothetical protein